MTTESALDAISIEDIIKKDYIEAERDRAQELVMRYGEGPREKEVDRVRRAVLKLSHGDIHRLNRLINSAKQDYEDVLWWAEEEEEGE